MNKDFKKWLTYESGIRYKNIAECSQESKLFVLADDIGKLLKYDKRYPNKIDFRQYGEGQWLLVKIIE